MIHIKNIMELLGVPQSTAEDIFQEMCVEGADFSEMTAREFRTWAHAVYAGMIDPDGYGTF